MAGVSIIVPVYNVEKYLARCLDSISAQTERDLEIICVNDGSTDSSAEILADRRALDLKTRLRLGFRLGFLPHAGPRSAGAGGREHDKKEPGD